jgi:outer membrane PBP1 activator LpoA protein
MGALPYKFLNGVNMLNNHRLILLMVAALLTASCATSPTGRKQLMLVSEDSAIQSSAQAYVQQVGALQK